MFQVFVGVNCKADSTRFFHDFDIRISSASATMIDTMTETKELFGPFDSTRPRANWSMQRLCAHFLNIAVQKSVRIRTNWEVSDALDDAAKAYCLLDVVLVAQVCLHQAAISEELARLVKKPANDKVYTWDFTERHILVVSHEKQCARTGQRVYYTEDCGEAGISVRCGLLILKGSAAIDEPALVAVKPDLCALTRVHQGAPCRRGK